MAFHWTTIVFTVDGAILNNDEQDSLARGVFAPGAGKSTRHDDSWRITIARNLCSLTAISIIAPFAGWVSLSFVCRIHSERVWDYGPGWLAMAVQRMLRGQPLYTGLFDSFSPKIVYNPLSILVAAILTPLFGQNPFAPLEGGRLFVVSGTALTCILIVLLARREGGSSTASLILAMCFLLSPLLEPLGFDFRVDVPALALELAGLYLFEEQLPWAAVVLFILAFFTKQSYVAGIGAVLLYLLLNQRWRSMLLIGFGWLISVSMLIVMMQTVWPYYMTNVYYATAPIFAFRASLSLDASALLRHFAIFALAAGFLIRKGPKVSPAACFLLVAAASDAAFAMRWGSNTYYFLPTVAAGAIVAAPELTDLLDLLASLSLPLQVLSGLAIAWVVSAQVAFARDDLGQLWRTALPHRPGCSRPATGSWDARALERLRLAKGTVFTDTPELMFVVPSARIGGTDLAVLRSMRERGLFDDSQFLGAIRNHEFAMFAFDGAKLDKEYRGIAFFWPDLRKTIEANYQAVPNIGPPFLMVPKEAAATLPSVAKARRSQSFRSAPATLTQPGFIGG